MSTEANQQQERETMSTTQTNGANGVAQEPAEMPSAMARARAAALEKLRASVAQDKARAKQLAEENPRWTRDRLLRELKREGRHGWAAIQGLHLKRIRKERGLPLRGRPGVHRAGQEPKKAATPADDAAAIPTHILRSLMDAMKRAKVTEVLVSSTGRVTFSRSVESTIEL